MREKAPEGASSLVPCAGAELMTPTLLLPGICLATLWKPLGTESLSPSEGLGRLFFLLEMFSWWPSHSTMCPWFYPYLVAFGGESRMMAGRGRGRRWGKCSGVWEEGHGDERPEQRVLGGWGREESTTHPGSLSSCFSLQMGSNLWCFQNVLDRYWIRAKFGNRAQPQLWRNLDLPLGPICKPEK